jgi:hypothetical protein
MTNEQIRENICEELEKLKKQFSNSTYSFELNPDIQLIKARIETLKKSCTHKNLNNEYALNCSGRCEYCGARIEMR